MRQTLSDWYGTKRYHRYLTIISTSIHVRFFHQSDFGTFFWHVEEKHHRLIDIWLDLNLLQTFKKSLEKMGKKIFRRLHSNNLKNVCGYYVRAYQTFSSLLQKNRRFFCSIFCSIVLNKSTSLLKIRYLSEHLSHFLTWHGPFFWTIFSDYYLFRIVTFSELSHALFSDQFVFCHLFR